MKYCNNILKRIERNIVKRRLLEEGDRVLVGLSGGKDSLILLESLAESKKNLPFNFELFAVHIHIESIGYYSDIEFLRSYCEEINIPFIFKEIQINEKADSKKGICFVCSWYRRKTMFDATREFNCNKLALGHHMDDALETLLMNMIYHGSMSSMPYSVSMFDDRVEMIRPLLELTDDELKKFADLRRLQAEIKTCPHSDSKRKEIAKLIQHASEIHKHARKNMFRSLSNIYPVYLPKYHN